MLALQPYLISFLLLLAHFRIVEAETAKDFSRAQSGAYLLNTQSAGGLRIKGIAPHARFALSYSYV